MCLVGDKRIPVVHCYQQYDSVVPVEMDVRMLVKYISETKKRSVISYCTWLCIQGNSNCLLVHHLERLIPEEMKVVFISSIGEIHFVMDT